MFCELLTGTVKAVTVFMLLLLLCRYVVEVGGNWDVRDKERRDRFGATNFLMGFAVVVGESSWVGEDWVRGRS